MSTSAPRAGRRRLRDVVTDDSRRQAYLRSGAWDSTTLVDRVCAHARERPDAVAVVDLLGERRRTYGELERDASRVAGFLVETGVLPGDVVAVQLPNRYETVVIAVGVLMAGAVINPMLPVYRSKELRHMLRVGGTRVMFLPDSHRGHDHVAMVGALEAPEPRTRVVVRLEGAPLVPAGWTRFESLLERGAGPTPGPGPAAEEVSELIFTSGTEADPKAIMHTEQTTNFSVRTAWSSLSMDPDDVVWMPSPIGHSTGFNYGVRMALYHGLKLVLQDRWDGADAARLIEAERCTYTLAATTFLRDLVEAGRRGVADISSLSLFGSGGAPVPPELVRAAAEQGVTVLRLYGSTEALVATWNRRTSPEERRVQTDGVAVDGVEVQTWDDEGRSVTGQPGEIQTRGPNTCVGFLDDPERTAATFSPEGWVRSGDLAVLDGDGYLTVVGRRKEIIIRGGLNIAPREIEDILVRMPGVRAVAVVGLPHDRLGEIGCACIVPAEGAEIALGTVTAHLDAAGLARYKQPERLELVDQIPMTSTGKIQKFRLVEAILARERTLPPLEGTLPPLGEGRVGAPPASTHPADGPHDGPHPNPPPTGGGRSVTVERVELEPGGVAAVVTLDRPEQLNAIDWGTIERLEEVLLGVDADPAVRAVLIIGRGRAFSAGGDLKSYVSLQADPVGFPAFLEDLHRTFQLISRMRKPVVALVNGVAAAGGLELILSCDFAYAAASATIGDGHLTYGQMGGGGVLTLLPRAIGPARARELVLSGRWLTAEEARAWGIVNRVVPDGDLLRAGLEFAATAAGHSPLAMANAKSVLNSAWSDGTGVEAGLRLERERNVRYCLTSEDAREGLQAFQEKRQPRFVGR